MTAAAALDSPRLRLRVRGVVQGVGFRPFAYGVAERLGLAGFVRNDGEGVLIEVEGEAAPAFVEALRSEAPPLARIEAVEVESCAASGDVGFAIEASREGATRTRIGADAAICAACLDDLFDPASRFHAYPLVNCTHCGPRYTITRGLPYDRARTAMAPFAMCPACARDYGDPHNRRFHAEPIACRECGPKLDASIEEIAACLAGGGIAAVKGLGGFHLMCDARNEAAVARLRARKAREAKPFAAMVLNVASARLFAEVGAAEREAFEDSAAPVVLMRRRGHEAPDRFRHARACPGHPRGVGSSLSQALLTDSAENAAARNGVDGRYKPGHDGGSFPALAPSVAPGLAHVGLMRAYTPLHWLILHALAGKPEFVSWRDAACGVALVATSANLSGEPLIADDAEARAALADVADLVVGHARAIVARADDSVTRVLDGRPAYLRRARGVAPDPIDLGADGPSVIAHGGDLKNTICVTRGREAFVSPYLGDLDNLGTIRFRDETIRHLTALVGVEPEIVVCDHHPDFVSTRMAAADGRPVVRVQHHVAHVAACAAEQGWSGPVLGVALDGFGLGTDGAAWGGELIALDGAAWRRVGWLAPLALPGGDKAAREPWRMGVAALHKLGRGAEAARRFAAVPEAGRLAQALARGARFGVTTSLGRVFDAAAALSGVCLRQHYEGEAAMRLEALVSALPAAPRCWSLDGGQLDLTPLLALLPGEAPREAAELFHGGLVAALAEWIGEAARAEGVSQVALGGGCVMNAVLTDGLCAALRARGLVAMIPRKLPANDGGLSYGQAAFALNGLR